MTSKESKVAERILQNCHKPGLELKQLQLSENAITVVMELLERVNKGSEELYIPSPKVWTRQEHWTDRDSYLGKSLAGTLVGKYTKTIQDVAASFSLVMGQRRVASG